MRLSTVDHRTIYLYYVHCVKSVQIRSYFWSVFSCIRTEFSPNTETYGPEITPYNSVFGHFSRSGKYSDYEKPLHEVETRKADETILFI